MGHPFPLPKKRTFLFFFNFFKFYLFFYMSAAIHHTHVGLVPKEVVSLHVGTGNRTCVFYNNKKSF